MTAEPTDSQRDLIRASNSDREAILAILHEALAEGRITSGEFSERSAVATSARTFGDLRTTISDLPVEVTETGLEPTGSGRTGAGAVDGTDIVEWRGSLSSLKRKGPWQVPRKIVLRRRLGSVELDFSEAQFTSAVVDIEIDIVGGSLEMRLPEGASASIHEVVVLGGSVEDHRKNAPGSGRPHIRLSGSLRWGSVEIRGPRRRIFG